MYLNKAMIYGNLTRDPELKSLPSGMQVCSFSIATNRRYKDRDGKYVDAVDYHNVAVFGRQAETSAQYLKKGASAYVEGRLQTRSWEQDGVKHYRTEIIADRVQFGPRSGGDGGGAYAQSSNAAVPPKEEKGGGMPDYPEEEINPEDIPF